MKNEVRTEENRYCPTCQKKTPHWVTRVTFPPGTDGSERIQRVERMKTECRSCRTVNQTGG